MDRNKIKTLSDLFLFITEQQEMSAFSFRRGKEIVEVSRSQFKADVLRTGAAIAQLLPKGGRIALIGENSYAYITAFFATGISGRVPVLLDKALDTETLSRVLTLADASVVLCSEEYEDIAKSLKPCCISFSSLSSYSVESLKEPVQTLPEDVCAIFHTSSSTGAPKVVPLTNRNVICEVCAMNACVTLEGTVLLCLPLYHVYGLIANVLSVLYAGLHVFINDSLRRLLKDIQQVQPTVLVLVPIMYDMLNRSMRGAPSPEAFRMLVGKNLKYICFGGASLHLDPSLMLSAGITLYIGYGLTETSASITMRKLTSPTVEIDNVGKPLDSVEIRIGEQNEILVRGDMVFGGYLQESVENNDSFVEGWFRTGDMGYVDENGNIHITGRSKNLIILPNGENVPGEKLESLLYTLPYVTECIVKEHEGKITALIYSEQQELAKENIGDDLSRINARLPLNHAITAFIFRDEPFPKTSSQKIKCT